MGDSSDDQYEETSGTVKPNAGDPYYSTDEESISDPFPASVQKEVLSSADLAEADLHSGFEVVSRMTALQMNSLLSRLESLCSPTDTYSVNVRLKRLNWMKVAFDNFSSDDCRVAWLYIKHQTRRHRIMHEIIQEVKLAAQQDLGKFRCRLIETAPGFPKRPPVSAASLFVREMWKANPDKHKINFIVFQKECLEDFQKLEAYTQTTWQKKWNTAGAEYETQVKNFYAKYPKYNYFERSRYKKSDGGTKKSKVAKGSSRLRFTTTTEQNELYPDAPLAPTTPQGEFVQSKISQLETNPTGQQLSDLKLKFSRKWQNLSDRKKKKWVVHVLERLHHYNDELEIYQQKHPEYITRPTKLRNHLSKSDIDIWACESGQPQKPAHHVFDFFWRQKCNELDYADLPEAESRRLAEEEYKTLDAYDRELCKINYSRAMLEYKRNIEKFFEWTPDILKPHVLGRIPKKFHPVVATRVEKVPSSMLDEEETAEVVQQNEDEIRDDSLLPNVDVEQPPSKRKKKLKAEHSEQKQSEINDFVNVERLSHKKEKVDKMDIESEESSNTHHKRKKKRTNATERIDDISFNGNIAKGQNREKTRELKMEHAQKHTPDDYPETLIPRARDIDDVIRGIFDARPQIGRNYSVFYYYAKYVARESTWVNEVETTGLVETTRNIFTTFLGLSRHKKNIFIMQSWEWHERTKEMIPKRDKTTGDTLMPIEPPPPPKNACILYNRETKTLKRRGFENTGNWAGIGEEKQQLYMKKLYRESKRYGNEYETYLMKLTPEEFVTYTIFQAKTWEKRVLRANRFRGAWRGFIFPLDHETPSNQGKIDFDQDSDVERLESRVFRVRDQNNRLHARLPSGLDNQAFINLLTKRTKPKDLSATYST